MTFPDGASLTWRDWGDVASFDTMDEAVAYVKSGEMEHARCALRFKRNRKNPGTGGAPLKKNYICCTHLNCPMQVRAVQTCGKFTVQQLKKVRHASKVNPDSRRGGIFKQKDVALVKVLVDSGARPAEIMASLTKEACKAMPEGQQPAKRLSGGLTCEQCRACDTFRRKYT